MIPDADGWLRYDLKFTDSDLAHNRLGQLSDSQLAALKQKLGDRLVDTAIGECLLFTILATIPAFLIYFQNEPAQNCIPAASVLLIWYVLRIIWQWLKGSLDVHHQQVISTRATVVEPPPNRQDMLHSRLFLTAHKPNLELVVPAMYFEKGQQYHFYYFKRTKLIVSAERVASPTTIEELSQ